MSEISKLLKESSNPQERLMAETRGLYQNGKKQDFLKEFLLTQKRVVCPFF